MKDIEEAIGFLNKRKSDKDMSVDEAILLVRKREGCVFDWDYELMEAAEVLALEVYNLQRNKDV